MLNPAQEKVLEVLGAPRAQHPHFEPSLQTELEALIERELAPLVEMAQASNDKTYINKHSISQIMGCEQKFLAERAIPFEWSTALARGSIAHKAIELSMHRRHQTDALTLVDEALDRLSEAEDYLGDWLHTISETERAELRAESNDRVVKFLECFPPLKTQWQPTTESRLRLEVHDCFVFSGKVDLTLGSLEGTKAGKVLIDFKTGGFAQNHHEDLRFYALIECIRVGVPPRRTASYYLDQARLVPEDITTEVLFAAAKRLIAATTKIIETTSSQRPAKLAAGPACRWCPLRVDCETGKRYLDEDRRDEPNADLHDAISE
ncbi:MAG: PD-(D/E)XK nuclease family protein [Acidimicrobiia bacterium]|nr:PD-(D/E)XK nuclease family protein [Acidimicrobiia bacterium]